VEEIMVWLVLL